jgi:hypothetical protein
MHRYGEDGDANTPSPLYKVLSVPSRVLQSHNIEILVSKLFAPDHVPRFSSQSSTESLLVPKLLTMSARHPVPFPVHKALILGEGLNGAIHFGAITPNGIDEEIHDVVKMAVDLPVSSDQMGLEVPANSVPINIDIATKALGSFRESIQNSIAYERGWFQSGLPTLSDWLVEGLQTSEPIKPTMKALVSSILEEVETCILKKELAGHAKQFSVRTEPDVTVSIVGHLESWAEQSHAELRDQLDEAFTAKNWHKLVWWKLFWRVDDVTMLASEILEQRWLVSAERNSIYLAGRMNQAGFPDEVSQAAVAHIPEVTTMETAPTAENPRKDLAMSTNVRKPMKWSDSIATARTELIDDTVPPLQALAQRLILQTFSTTSLSSAASALLYVTTYCSVFEASAIAALGLTVSLRRMQKLWEGARESWQGTVREEGRRTLKGTEEGVRFIIRNKGKEERGEDEEVVERRTAREAVSKVREALERMGGGGKVV